MPELHELFNNKLNEFLKELISTFPEDLILSYSKHLLE